jgi:putative transposase
LKNLAAVRVRYHYRRLHVLLRREGWFVNHKCIYRLCNKEGLSIRSKLPLPRPKRAWRYRRVGRRSLRRMTSGPWTSCPTRCSTVARSGF